VSGGGGFCNEVADGKSGAKAPREERPRKVAKPTKEPEPKARAKPRQVEPAPAVAAPVPAPGPAKPEPAQGAAPAAQSGAAFVQARDLILNGQYDAGIAAMRALKFDDHPDVATFIGLAYRKLGRIDEAKSWYQRALATDPNHKLALSYDGMMRAEQGDIPGAQANLIRIGRLCGDISCNEYQALQGVIAARMR
jgi:tetratricopeptide (TPR) repeat protein